MAEKLTAMALTNPGAVLQAFHRELIDDKQK
jgi:hypothetical protein